MLWLEKCYGIKVDRLTAIVGNNQTHISREEKVTEYWSKITGIPIEQFRKTSFKKVNNTKVYSNLEEHFGTLSVLVTKSTNLYFQIIGEIEGLALTDFTAA